MGKRRHEIVAASIGFYLCCCLFYYVISFVIYSWFVQHSITNSFSHRESTDSLSFNHRQLLSSNEEFPKSGIQPNSTQDLNCTPPDIEQFPRPMMDYNTRRKGGLLIHIFVSLYMFLGLAIICDEYFVPSLEKICNILEIQSDVAGATFMAAGSSAPELATAVIAVFVAKDDIGIGTVVGSAVFNIAFVIGVCGLFAGRAIYLNWWPMFRDCMFYLISILALLFALRDESVSWVESVLFLVLYILYILFMFVNRRVEKWITKFECFSRFRFQVVDPANSVSYHPLPDPAFLENGTNDKFCMSNADILSNTESMQQQATEDEGARSMCTPPAGCLKKTCWVISLPYLIVCSFTIPDCRKLKWRGWIFLSFLLSCAWIGGLSYILVWMITIIGFTLHIRDTIMGLTFLAAGASIPDAISSLIVVRDGLGDMAVSNAVGSNVFDILLCLGLPWFLQTVVVSPGSEIIVRSRGLTYSTLSLLLTVVFLLGATHCNGWKLNKKYGAVLLAWYVLFMVVATLYESNLFGISSLPTCPSDF